MKTQDEIIMMTAIDCQLTSPPKDMKGEWDYILFMVVLTLLTVFGNGITVVLILSKKVCKIQTTAVNSTAVQSTIVQSTTFQSTALQSTTLQSTTLQSTTLQCTTVQSTFVEVLSNDTSTLTLTMVL